MVCSRKLKAFTLFTLFSHLCSAFFSHLCSALCPISCFCSHLRSLFTLNRIVSASNCSTNLTLTPKGILHKYIPSLSSNSGTGNFSLVLCSRQKSRPSCKSKACTRSHSNSSSIRVCLIPFSNIVTCISSSYSRSYISTHLYLSPLHTNPLPLPFIYIFYLSLPFIFCNIIDNIFK